MSCFSCGKNVNDFENRILQHAKEHYVKYNVVRYFYRLKKGGDLLFVRAKYFNQIFEKEIKPNIENGAEYASIEEL